MKQTRKIYDRAFKEKAVQLSYERHNLSELARELGITAPQLYKWRKEVDYNQKYNNSSIIILLNCYTFILNLATFDFN